MKLFDRHIDRTNALIAALVWLGVTFVYLQTKAVTMSFWDCGEFIAVSAILGIPHPPGTPLYILVGHLFSKYIPLADISARVNVLSSLSSSVAALFAYLSAVRILRSWFSDKTDRFSRFLTYAGGVCGAALFSFSFTQWNNSIEAEVYGLSMLIMMAIFWLTMVYIEHWETPRGSRIMMLVVYLATLGIGVHMATFLILPIAALFFVLKKDTPAGGWFLVAVFFAAELFLIFLLSSRPDEIPFFIPVLIVLIIYTFYVFSFEKVPSVVWIIFAGLLLSVLPIFAVIANELTGVENTTPPAFLGIIGAIGLIGITGYALYLLAQRDKMDKADPSIAMHYLYPPLFVLAAALFAAIAVLNLRGYAMFLLFSVVFLAGLGFSLRKHINWFALIPLVGISTIILGVVQFAIGLLVAGIIAVALGLYLKDTRWKQSVVMLLVAVIGFSVHVYIPVRSAEDPFINENNPSRSLEATIQFIERKQYGSESMVERMFNRRAEWSNQFGTHERMGFWGFFRDQYGLNGPRFFLLFMLGLFGIWEIVRRKPRIGLHLLLVLLLTSIGLVLYMNFADGTRLTPAGQDYLEVRDRDYFWTGAFILFGMTIGIGVATLVQFVRESVASFSKAGRTIVVTSICVLFLLPVYAIAGNYYQCDRSRNYIAYDYGFNLLMSADQNAVLFTNGDNDTFPLWCLQEAYGLRKDVRVVNLSLANLDWYIMQLRDYMGLELGWTDEQIQALRGYRFEDGQLYRVSHQVIDAIYQNNYPRVPINFAVTCSAGFRRIANRSIDHRLELSGMKWRLMPDGQSMTVNVPHSIDLLTDTSTFRFRGLNDPSIYKDETTLRVTFNMGHTILMVADTLRRAGNLEAAADMARLAWINIPHYNEAALYLANLYGDMGEDARLAEMVHEVRPEDREKVTVYWARANRTLGRIERAEQILDSLLIESPHSESAFEEMVKLYIEDRDLLKLKTHLENWLQHNPDHERARILLARLDQELIRLNKDTPSDSANHP
ncbi:DUF2723 domain-containing protein [bacterium]|nr:DUF2723 domain-containing protein [bacterium]MCB2201655.1 DUF2723 domain-containing protein [bacterium]